MCCGCFATGSWVALACCLTSTSLSLLTTPPLKAASFQFPDNAVFWVIPFPCVLSSRLCFHLLISMFSSIFSLSSSPNLTSLSSRLLGIWTWMDVAIVQLLHRRWLLMMTSSMCVIGVAIYNCINCKCIASHLCRGVTFWWSKANLSALLHVLKYAIMLLF